MASKTIAVNINGVVFHMAEAAYAAFEDYLKSVKKYFSKHEGKEEIIADLEGRIAEHFSEKNLSQKTGAAQKRHRRPYKNHGASGGF